MKVTKKALNDLKRTYKRNTLMYFVLNDILTEENPTDFIYDVILYGCVSGVVTRLIYYVQTEAFFKKYAIEIMEKIGELNESGFGINTYNVNDLTWIVYEAVVSDIATALGLEF